MTPTPLARVLALVLATSCAGAEEARSAPSDAHPIESNADLDRYLAAVAPGESPLDRLSTAAKRRFVDDFRSGFFLSPDDLEAELTRAEMLEVLKLFGAESAISALRPRPVPVPIGASETPEASARFDALRKAARSSEADAAVPRLYARDYAPLQSADRLRAMSDGDVALMFRAALAFARVDRGTRALDDERLDLGELEHRHVAAPAWFARVHAGLVERRDFAAATRFASEHPDANLRTLPPFHDAVEGEGPTVLAIDDAGAALVRRTVALDPSAQVVVVAGCHFAMDAARDIDADAGLREAFARHVAWITPAEWDPADPDLVRWNREHPAMPIGVAYRASEWPMIDSWSMPTFYFLRDGRVAAKVRGWQGHREAVLAGFRAIGLAP